MPRTGDNYDNPAGTLGIPGQTIFSARYNAWVEDVKATFNLPLPISKGGTNGTTPAQARDNLDAEVAGQNVTDFNLHNFENGSFWADKDMPNAPLPGRYFVGTAQLLGSNPTLYQSVVARTSDAILPALTFTRQKVAGTWGAWSQEGMIHNTGGANYIGNIDADMSFGLFGTAPNSFFFVNSESDASGSNILGVQRLGPVTISSPNSVVAINSNDPAISTDIYLANSTVPRWMIRSAAPSGDFGLARFNSGGGFVEYPLYVSWADGYVSVAHDPTAAAHVATKNYVDATTVSLTGDTMTGLFKTAGSTGVMGTATPAATLEVVSAGGAGDGAFMAFNRLGSFASALGIDNDNVLKYGGWSNGTNTYAIHHNGNTPSTANYFKFPTSIMFVYGQSNTSGNDAAPITFPVAFPTTCLGVLVIPEDAATAANVALAYSVRSRSTTSFTVSQRYSSAGVSGAAGSPFSYIAWGF